MSAAAHASKGHSAKGNFGQNLMIFIAAALVVVLMVWFVNLHDRESAGDRLGGAVDSLPHQFVKTSNKIDHTVDNTLNSPSTKHTVGDVLRKTGQAASAAMSETSEDFKAAVDRQKQQSRRDKEKSGDR